MSQGARRASVLAEQLDAMRADRDREAEARRAALTEVESLRAEVVRLHARLQVLEEAVLSAPPRLRGLASLLGTGPV